VFLPIFAISATNISTYSLKLTFGVLCSVCVLAYTYWHILANSILSYSIISYSTLPYPILSCPIQMESYSQLRPPAPVRAPGCAEPLTTVTRTASSPAPSVPVDRQTTVRPVTGHNSGLRLWLLHWCHQPSHLAHRSHTGPDVLPCTLRLPSRCRGPIGRRVVANGGPAGTYTVLPMLYTERFCGRRIFRSVVRYSYFSRHFEIVIL
jgi:hypothetical protein